jgi:RHS repeat-associated protein
MDCPFTQNLAHPQDSSNGSYLPSRMDYTGNASSTPVLSPGMSVVFVPGTASRLDAVTGYQAGASYLNPKRIDKIQTYVGAALVKEYRLDYVAQSTALDRSQLSSITECDATGSCLPATSIQWGAKGADAFATYSTWLNGQYGTAQGWASSAVYPRQMVDMNGDGLPDIVGFAGGGVYVALNAGTSTGFAAPRYWLSTEFGVSHGWTDNNKFPRYVDDVNGDGLPDVVGFGPNGMRVALNNGGGFDPATTMLSDFSVAQGWADNDTLPRQLVDVNGDGLPDVVGFKANGVYVALNTRTGFSAPTPWLANQFGTNQGWTSGTLNPRQLVDVNGDGLPDIVGFAGTGVTVALNTGAGFETSSSLPANYSCSADRTLIGSACGVPANPVLACPPQAFSASQGESGEWYCALTGGRNPPTTPPIVVGFSCTSGMGALQGSSCTIPASYSCPTGYTSSGSSCSLTAGGTTASASWNLAQFGISQGWIDSNLHPRQLADVNGDGLPDIVGFGPNGVVVSLNTGRSFSAASTRLADFGTAAGSWTNNTLHPRQLADVNGDGLPDIVGFAPNGVMVSLNDGASFKAAVNWNAYFGVIAGGWSDNSTYPRVLADVNGDGVPDVLGFGSSTVEVALNSRNAPSAYVSRIQTGTGESFSPQYATLANSAVYIRDSGANKASAPMMDVAWPLYVVSQVDRSNGLGSNSGTSYTYGGLKAELGTGRGMLGFRWTKSKNQDTQLESYTEFRQDFPYTGTPLLQETRLSGAGNAGVVRRVINNYACTNPQTSAACTVAAGNRYFVYAGTAIERAWDINGAALPVTTLTTSYANNPNGMFLGDATQVQQSTDAGGGVVFSKSTLNEYYSADTTNWILGSLKQATLTSNTPSDSKVRITALKYTTQGLLSEETQEPTLPEDCLQTRYGYDSFGNRTSVSAAACEGASGNTVLSAGTARSSTDNFGTDGRFALTSTNALNQSETKTYDNRFGTLATLTDPNSLSTSRQTDNFGRRARETRVDGTYTLWTYQLCTQAGAACPTTVGPASVVWVVTEQGYAVNGAVASTQKRQYYDTLNRVVRVQTQGFDGAGVAAPSLIQDTEYNVKGQIARQSAWFASTGTPVWTSYSYDALGRISTESRPDSAAAGGIATTSYAYNGLSTTVTNAKSQTKTSVKNALGQIANVTDAQGNVISYQYDAQGNLTQTNAASSVTKLRYDLRGRKIAMQDPSMGSWIYGYNAFGELVTQRDSLNQTTTLAYDALGRMVKRTEPDLVSDWSYDKKFDATSCGKGVGKLCEAKSDNSYKRTLSYDALGRPISTSTVLDNPASPAVVSEAFDANTGRVVSKTYPTGYQAFYNYTPLGYLQSVTAGGTNGFTATQSYQVLAMNAQGQITQYKTGNNVTTVSTYDAQTQRLKVLQATRDGQAAGNVLKQTYDYDPLGNLTSSIDSAPGVGTQESFSYDSLNRLSTATLLGGAVSPPTTTEVMYDTRGNITYKSDVGRYWYDAARPNRMTNVTLETAPGAMVPLSGTRALSYAFDDAQSGVQSVAGTTVGNGNLTYTVSLDTVNNRHTVRWESYTSSNMLSQVTYGNFTANTTTCPAGYTLSNGSCTMSSNTAVPATEVYSCPAGQTLSGTNCTQTTTSVATPNYTCPGGYSLSGSSCISVSNVAPSPVMGCPAGYEWRYMNYDDGPSGYYCAIYAGSRNGYNTTPQIVVGSSCPSGYSMSGAVCTRTVTVGLVVASYSCPAGWTLSGSNCSITSVSSAAPVAATPVYACLSPATVVGSQCVTSTSAAAAPVMGCPYGYTAMDYDGWTCAKIVSYSAGNSPNYSTTGFVVVGYTCPAGTTLSGASCLTSVTTAATIASYTCPAGRNLVGNGCVLPGATFAGYACSTGTLNGNNCIVATTSTVAPGSSNASDRTLSFLYGPEHQRIKQNVTLSGNGTSAYFSGNTWYLNGEDSLGLTYEKEVRTNGTTEHKHYVNAAGFTFALFTSRTGTLNGLAATTTSYFHKDHLGSVSVIADETGAVTERLAYDPWGKRRFANTTPGLTDKLDAIVGVKTDRGYTEHEHLDEVGVIHMNGRVYDPLMGRFMSADPIVQTPYNLKSFNRYSYVWNNPLANFDPTGFFSWSVGGPSDTSTPTSYGYTPTSTSAQRGESYGCTGCGTSESNGSIGSSRNHVTGSNSNSETQSWRPLSGGFSDCLNGGCGSVLAPPVNLGGKIGKAVREYGWSAPQLVGWGIGGLWGIGQAVHDGDLSGVLFSAATIPLDLWGAGASGAVLRSEKLATKAAAKGVGEYGTVLGHHVHAKRAFEGVAGYDRIKAFAVSDNTLAEFGVRHADITTAQNRLFRALDASGAPNTLTHHSRVAYQAMVEAGVPSDAAKQLVTQSQTQLIRSGVVEPARIPWGKR